MGTPTRAPSDPEVRARAIQLVRTRGLPRAQDARALGLNAARLRLWVEPADADAGRRDGLTTAERAALARPRREVAVLEEGRALLKKAAALFARERATR